MEVSASKAAQLVRITDHDESNRYTARPVVFDAAGEMEIVGEDTLTVTNLAEPTDTDGQVPDDTDAVAIDVGGRWIVFIRPVGSVVFPARITASQGAAAYNVREQVATGAGTFTDAPGATNLTAHNLAELSLGPGAAVANDTIVLVLTIMDNGTPPTVRYVFDHPAYAKYLD
ncbi:MAG: hypothetical protein SVV80_13530 [Planctomycetota bacterium]|nr:hypothetical protein [Planctomycetota bacterium]